MLRTSDGWIGEYKNRDALWIHDGNPKRPHALLRSGMHSSGFFNSRLVIPHDLLMDEAAFDLLQRFYANGGDIRKVDCVVGPQTGATKLAEYMSRTVAGATRNDCFWASPSKYEAHGRKSMVFTERDHFEILPGKRVLLCEDVLTTGGSVDLAANAVLNARGTSVLPFIAVLVNRSGLKEVNGRKIVSLIDHHMPVWSADECPLCKQGSKAMEAKGDNWALLNGEY